MGVLSLSCSQRTLAVDNSSTLYSGAVKVDTVEILFDDEWTDYFKTAVFFVSDKNVYHAYMTNDVAVIPSEVLVHEGTLHVGVFGLYGDKRLTSSILKVRVHKGAFMGGVTPSGKDVYTQLEEILAGKADKTYIDGRLDEAISDMRAFVGNLEDLNGKYNGSTVVDFFLEIYNKLLKPKPLSDIIGVDIPEIYITANNWSEMTKDNAIDCDFIYHSDSLEWNGVANIKWQGSSSINYPKKNFTIKLYSDSSKTEKQKFNMNGWGSQNKFVLKANYQDRTHARNIVSANLWSEIVASRSKYADLPKEVRNSPNNCAVDGFPVKVTVNGTYQGVYTWNIPKDAWMFNIDEDDPNQCVLCAEYNWNNGADGNAIEFRGEAKIDGSDWSVEVPDTCGNNIITSFNTVIKNVMTFSDPKFKYGIDKYLDVESLVDYFIFAYFGGFVDSLGKNLIMMTYDGFKWYASMYDMDSTWGIRPGGTYAVSHTTKCPDGYIESKSLLWSRVKTVFATEIKARYAELRSGVLSVDNVVNKFKDFMDIIGEDLYAGDLKPYPDIPQINGTLSQITEWVTNRAAFVDGEIAALVETEYDYIPIASISADNEITLDEDGSAVITVTISPDNATDQSIVYRSNDESIATVDRNGNITAVAPGTTTITIEAESDPEVKHECKVTVVKVVYRDTFKVYYNNSWSAYSVATTHDDTLCLQALYNSDKCEIDEKLVGENSFGEITNTAISADFGLDRMIHNAVKFNNVEGWTPDSSGKTIIVRILKSRLSEPTPEGMAEYFSDKPLVVNFHVDPDKYEYVAHPLAGLNWKGSGNEYICTDLPFNLTSDSRIITYIQTYDGKWTYKRGDYKISHVMSGFGTQLKIYVTDDTLTEKTVSGLIKYLTAQSAKLVYVVEKS